MTVFTDNFSPIAVGLWRVKHWGFSPQQLLAFIEQNIELGLTTMDHAMVYGSEKPFGEAISLKPEIKNHIQIVTKCGIRPADKGLFGWLSAEKTPHFNSSCEHILMSVDHSLQNMKVDAIDLLLIHRPDYLMQVDEVAKAFDILKANGKVKFFGVSNFTVSQFDALQSTCDEPLVTNQIEVSPLHMQALDNGSLDLCQRYKISPMFWSCLAAGELIQSTSPKAMKIRSALAEVAHHHQVKNIETIVFAWLLSLPVQGVPIVGSRHIERIKQAVDALDIRLTREEWYKIWEASNGAPVP